LYYRSLSGQRSVKESDLKPESCRFTALPIMALLALVVLPAGSVTAEIFSYYVETRDGTRLAVDVALPGGRDADAKHPTLVEFTRYWRASEDPESGEPLPSLDVWDRAFLSKGYAVVQVDVRGSGASFGTRMVEYGPQEVRDGWDVVEWIVGQPWSDGNVGAYGTSYSGTTAEMLAATGHPAIKAVSPGWSDFDTWRSPARPYGLYAADFIQTWGGFVGMLDRNDPAIGAVVKRVDADADGTLRVAAVKQHASNADVASSVGGVDFRDERLPGAEESFADLCPMRWSKEIQKSGVPMLVIASWLDAGTAEGALWRFANFSNPQWLILQAASHGGGAHASPYVVGGEAAPPVMATEEQIALRLQFFDHFLKGIDNGADRRPRVRYYNLGEETFLESGSWPPAGGTHRRLYARAGGVLGTDAPTDEDGSDRYEVDFSVSTGAGNRWMTQLGQPVVGLDDRASMDARMLTYTSPALESDLQITGFPTVRLEMASTHTDGAVLVYLEDVAPDGRSRYLTEGGLRLLHRKVDPDPGFEAFGPVHSFATKDALPMVPGETATIDIRLNPVSVKIARGHRIRLAIAGADAAIFRRVPESGNPTLTIERNSDRASFLQLPVLDAASDR
jgi:putative CocE/NonD family hydrolase